MNKKNLADALRFIKQRSDNTVGLLYQARYSFCMGSIDELPHAIMSTTRLHSVFPLGR